MEGWFGTRPWLTVDVAVCGHLVVSLGQPVLGLMVVFDWLECRVDSGLGQAWGWFLEIGGVAHRWGRDFSCWWFGCTCLW